MALSPDQWKAHVTAQRKSNLTEEDYCVTQGLNHSSFLCWVHSTLLNRQQWFLHITAQREGLMVPEDYCAAENLHLADFSRWCTTYDFIHEKIMGLLYDDVLYSSGMIVAAAEVNGFFKELKDPHSEKVRLRVFLERMDSGPKELISLPGLAPVYGAKGKCWKKAITLYVHPPKMLTP